MKRPIEFTINIKVKTGTGCFEALTLLDGGAKDCFIDEDFVRSKGLKLTKLPKYLQQHTQNADNMLSTKKLKYEVSASHALI